MASWKRKKRSFKTFLLLFVICLVSAFTLFYIGSMLNKTVSKYSTHILDLKKDFDKYEKMQRQYKKEFEKAKDLFKR